MARALVLGSTGLVGSRLLQKLLDDPYFTEVAAWVRRDPGLTHPKLQVEQTDFQSLPSLETDIVFSCLGTTRRQTPDPDIYRFIEVAIPINTAVTLQAKGLKQFHYISSVGVNPDGRGAYLQNKWDTESGLKGLDIPSLFLYRPSLIYGPRPKNRPAEAVANFILRLMEPVLTGKMKKYRRISADTIAEAMVRNAKNPTPGVHILESDKIQETGA